MKPRNHKFEPFRIDVVSPKISAGVCRHCDRLGVNVQDFLEQAMEKAVEFAENQDRADSAREARDKRLLKAGVF